MAFNPSEMIMLLLATIVPLKVTVVCAALTAGATPEFLSQVALRSVLIASIVCIAFAVLGEAILNRFKVSVPAFQIGGALIVAAVGPVALQVIGKIMGVLLAALAVALMLMGLTGAGLIATRAS
jgi:small neutral amino acid transporter SnatA (MarC family)